MDALRDYAEKFPLGVAHNAKEKPVVQSFTGSFEHEGRKYQARMEVILSSVEVE